MGCRGNGVRPLRNHPGAGHVPHNLGAGKVAADPRLGALAHFDLNSSSGLQIILVHAESPGGHLNNGMGTVGIKILMQAALTGIIENSQFLSGARQTLVSIVADRSIGHSREHHWYPQLQTGRQIVDKVPFPVPFDRNRLPPKEHLGLHGLTQRINGGIGHLGSVNENLVPVHGKRLRIAHGGQQYAA